MWLRRLDEEEGLNIQKETLLYKCKTLLTVGTSFLGGHFLAGGEEGKRMSGGAGAPAQLLSLCPGLSGSLGLPMMLSSPVGSLRWQGAGGGPENH